MSLQPFVRIVACSGKWRACADSAIFAFMVVGYRRTVLYILPLIILACSKVSRRFLPVALVSMLVISLFFSQRLLSANPLELFYILPFRAFELLIGSLIALPAMHIKKSALTSTCLFVLGLAAAIPCLGAALIIMAGEQSGRI